MMEDAVLCCKHIYDFRKVGKRKAALKADNSQTKKEKKAKKDPNKPKRPPSAFFVFLYEWFFLTF